MWVSRLNYEPAGIRESGPSPREAFIGSKPYGKRDFRCSFGDYVQCTVPNTDPSLKPRTEDCVVMLPLGNRTGTVRMLSLSTGRMVNRDHFRVMPMPESVINCMNKNALADGRKKGKGVPTECPSSYTQDDGAREGLPNTIEVGVNNRVDPSVIPIEEDEVSERLNDPADGWQEEIGDMTCDALDLSEPTYTPFVANVKP